MPNYTISLTAAQDAALQAVVAQANVKRAAMTPPKAALTAAVYLQKRLDDVADSYVNQVAADDDLTVTEAFKLADATKRAQIKTTLGL